MEEFLSDDDWVEDGFASPTGSRSVDWELVLSMPTSPKTSCAEDTASMDEGNLLGDPTFEANLWLQDDYFEREVKGCAAWPSHMMVEQNANAQEDAGSVAGSKEKNTMVVFLGEGPKLTDVGEMENTVETEDVHHLTTFKNLETITEVQSLGHSENIDVLGFNENQAEVECSALEVVEHKGDARSFEVLDGMPHMLGTAGSVAGLDDCSLLLVLQCAQSTSQGIIVETKARLPPLECYPMSHAPTLLIHPCLQPANYHYGPWDDDMQDTLHNHKIDEFQEDIHPSFDSEEKPLVLASAKGNASMLSMQNPKTNHGHNPISWLQSLLLPWQAHARHSNTLWSFALGAATVGLLTLGRGWQHLQAQNQTLRMQLCARDKKITQLMFQLIQVKDSFTTTRRMPVIWAKPALRIPLDQY